MNSDSDLASAPYLNGDERKENLDSVGDTRSTAELSTHGSKTENTNHPANSKVSASPSPELSAPHASLRQ
jgi:hypothetical protein